MAAITPFRVDISQDQIDDLCRRLDNARWPEKEGVDDWSQGVPLAKARALCDHWRNRYDFHRLETRLNAHDQFLTEIDGLPIHFLHVRSPEPGARALLLTHGWPGSVIEFLKVIEPLSNPVAHGGKAEDAFHLVIPSLPGYGFSGKPGGDGWSVPRIAKAWATLMERLGYDKYFAQGGDWGASVTDALGGLAPKGLEAIHLNMVLVPIDMDDEPNWTEAERARVGDYHRFAADGSGYANLQRTRPQTVGYALVDSPTGQAAWIYEKFHAWTDCSGTPENALDVDEMLDNISLYWFTGTAASSARLYWHSMGAAFERADVNVPTGASIFPKEIMRPLRRWAEKRYHKMFYWNEDSTKGGHFAAFEQPGLFVDEVRACFRDFRALK